MPLNFEIFSFKNSIAPICMVNTLKSKRVHNLFHPWIDRQPLDITLIAVTTLIFKLMGAFKAEHSVDALRALNRILISTKHRIANTTLNQI